MNKGRTPKSMPMSSRAKAIRTNSLAMDEDDELWWLLSQTADLLLRAWQKELTQYGISTIEAGTLGVIQTIDERATQVEISRWLLREPQTVAELVDRMEKQELVRKTRNLDKKNSVTVSITDKGMKTYQQARRKESIRKVLSSLSEEERQQLITTLRILRKSAAKQMGLKHKPRFP
jgi:DNA-binding MarR family transcriptional regulator